MKQKMVIVVLGIAFFSTPGRAKTVQAMGWGVSVLEIGSSREAVHEQYALRDSLELMGIPYRATADIEEAARRPLVLIGGLMLNTRLTHSLIH